MERSLYKRLLAWKCSPRRKPLVLRGARQVGKTWLLKEFGRREYAKTVYVNCDKDAFTADLFRDYDLKRILLAVEAHSGVRVTPGDTLLVFDELQEAPRGIAALKYFCEDAPDIHVAVAGSLLGITLHSGTSYPVGKVDELTLRPLDFREFLLGVGERAKAELLDSCRWDAIDTLRGECTELLRRYFFTGGMPAAVSAFAGNLGLAEVRRLQRDIVRQYAEDISKHAPKNEVPRINMVWKSLLPQLAKENRKFIYGALKNGGRAKEFETAIQWLVDAGIAHRVHRVSKPGLPLKFYEDFGAFKLYPPDCGLMGAMADAPAGTVLDGNGGFEEYKGAFTAAYVLTEFLASADSEAFYFAAPDTTVEIDFLVQTGSAILPIEVKAGENLRSKSLRTFVASHPETHGIRFSLSPYREQEWMTNVPLYGVGAFFRRRMGLLQGG